MLAFVILKVFIGLMVWRRREGWRYLAKTYPPIWGRRGKGGATAVEIYSLTIERNGILYYSEEPTRKKPICRFNRPQVNCEYDHISLSPRMTGMQRDPRYRLYVEAEVFRRLIEDFGSEAKLPLIHFTFPKEILFACLLCLVLLCDGKYEMNPLGLFASCFSAYYCGHIGTLIGTKLGEKYYRTAGRLFGGIIGSMLTSLFCQFWLTHIFLAFYLAYSQPKSVYLDLGLIGVIMGSFFSRPLVAILVLTGYFVMEKRQPRPQEEARAHPQRNRMAHGPNAPDPSVEAIVYAPEQPAPLATTATLLSNAEDLSDNHLTMKDHDEARRIGVDELAFPTTKNVSTQFPSLMDLHEESHLYTCSEPSQSQISHYDYRIVNGEVECLIPTSLAHHPLGLDEEDLNCEKFVDGVEPVFRWTKFNSTSGLHEVLSSEKPVRSMDQIPRCDPYRRHLDSISQPPPPSFNPKKRWVNGKQQLQLEGKLMMIADDWFGNYILSLVINHLPNNPQIIWFSTMPIPATKGRFIKNAFYRCWAQRREVSHHWDTQEEPKLIPRLASRRMRPGFDEEWEESSFGTQPSPSLSGQISDIE